MGLGSLFKRGKKEEKQEDECHIDINQENCDACEKCSTACPNNVLMLSDGSMAVRDSQVCKTCRVCVAICPNSCIVVI